MIRLIQSPQQLALLLRTTRKARGLTQADVAARLGLSQNRYSELELEAGTLTVDRLLELCRVLGLEIFAQKAGGTPASAAALGDAQW